MSSISRRTSLRAIAAASATPLIGATSVSELSVDGTPVEVVLTRISDLNVRITILAVDGAQVANYGTLTDEHWPAPVATVRKAGATNVGALNIEVGGSPLTIKVRDGARLVQTLSAEPKGGLVFDLGDAPVLRARARSGLASTGVGNSTG